MSAYSCGMPCSSRTTSTSPVSPGTRDRPVDLGERPPHEHHRRAPDAATSRSTSPTATVRRPAHGPRPARKTCHRGTGSRGSSGSRHGGSQCAVPLAVACGECQPCREPPRPKGNRADLPVRLHRVRARLRPVPELLRRRADRVPGVPGPAAQGLQRRRRRLQGLRLLPHRQPRRRHRRPPSSDGKARRRKSGHQVRRRSPRPSPTTKSDTKSAKKSDSSSSSEPPGSRRRLVTRLWRAAPPPRRPAYGRRVLDRAAAPARPATRRTPRGAVATPAPGRAAGRRGRGRRAARAAAPAARRGGRAHGRP